MLFKTITLSTLTALASASVLPITSRQQLNKHVFSDTGNIDITCTSPYHQPLPIAPL